MEVTDSLSHLIFSLAEVRDKSHLDTISEINLYEQLCGCTYCWPSEKELTKRIFRNKCFCENINLIKSVLFQVFYHCLVNLGTRETFGDASVATEQTLGVKLRVIKLFVSIL